MKQLFLKKLIPVCVVAMLTATINVNATETVNTEQLSVAPLSANNDIPFFRAHRQARGIALQWVTNNIERMEIQYSYDAEFWDTIDEITVGNKSRQNYNIDQVFPGYHHYRLKGTTSDGTIIYSEVATVRIVQRN